MNAASAAQQGSIRAKLYPDDPYEAFPLEDWDVDLQGWGSDHQVFGLVMEAVRPSIVIEVGSWKGRSAVNIAALAKKLGLTPEIVCVDTWLGAPEHWLKRDHPAYWDSLKMRSGYPQLYYQFLANVLHSGHSDVITPLAQTSDNAAEILRRLGVTADVIYIDAAHEYGPVLKDLTNYWELLREGGVLFGDDYATSDGVTRAVHDFCRERKLHFLGERGKFLIPKGAQIRAEFALNVEGDRD
jgi:hypothetical protein